MFLSKVLPMLITTSNASAPRASVTKPPTRLLPTPPACLPARTSTTSTRPTPVVFPTSLQPVLVPSKLAPLALALALAPVPPARTARKAVPDRVRLPVPALRRRQRASPPPTGSPTRPLVSSVPSVLSPSSFKYLDSGDGLLLLSCFREWRRCERKGLNRFMVMGFRFFFSKKFLFLIWVDFFSPCNYYFFFFLSFIQTNTG